VNKQSNGNYRDTERQVESVQGTVVYAAIVNRLRLKRDDRGVYAVFLESDRWFFSANRPTLYDRNGDRIPPQPIEAGSTVRLKLDSAHRIEAIQLVDEVIGRPFAAIG
jgi:hypothetical protein